jgi:single-stranded-DNA-specific exonuclease
MTDESNASRTLTTAGDADAIPSAVWNIAPSPDASAVEALAEALRLPPLVARLLIQRGFDDPVTALQFLNPSLADLYDPFELPDMGRAVDRLALAIENREKIFLHGDYDADGVTSAALCIRALTSLGADVVGYVPKRTEGYDLQKAGVDRARACGGDAYPDGGLRCLRRGTRRLCKDARDRCGRYGPPSSRNETA